MQIKEGFWYFSSYFQNILEIRFKIWTFSAYILLFLGKFAYYVPLDEKGGRVHIVSYKKNDYHISDVWPMFSERCCYRVIKNHEFAHKREMITEYRIIHGACKNENAGE